MGAGAVTSGGMPLGLHIGLGAAAPGPAGLLAWILPTVVGVWLTEGWYRRSGALLLLEVGP